MELTINGECRELPDGSTVAELLVTMHFDPVAVRGVAVAVNEKIVRRTGWGETILAPGDRIEIVTAQQGG